LTMQGVDKTNKVCMLNLLIRRLNWEGCNSVPLHTTYFLGDTLGTWMSQHPR